MRMIDNEKWERSLIPSQGNQISYETRLEEI